MGKGLRSTFILGGPFWLRVEWTGGGGEGLTSETGPAPQKCTFTSCACPVPGKEGFRGLCLVALRTKAACENIHTDIERKEVEIGGKGIEGTSTVKPLGPRLLGSIAGSLDAFSPSFLTGDNSLLDFCS